MSIPRFSLEERPSGYRYGLAVMILREIAPRILSINNPLTSRVAVAYSWYLFIRSVAPATCRKYCSDMNENYREWGEDEPERVAKALIEYASGLLKSLLGGQQGGIPVPRPP